MTNPLRSQSGRQGSGSGEAIPPWTCALTRRGRYLRAAASVACVLRQGPTRWQAGAARRGRDSRTEIRASSADTSLLESAAAEKTRAACGPPAPPGNLRRRDLPPPPSGNHCSSRLDLLPLPRLGSSLSRATGVQERYAAPNQFCTSHS